MIIYPDMGIKVQGNSTLDQENMHWEMIPIKLGISQK